jgi:hypothetical protein
MTATPALEWFARAVFALLGVVHALPALGVLGKPLLERAYGVTLASADLLVLMQHRALLFALVSAACLGAAISPAWRWPVAVMTLVSMLGFVAIASLYPHSSAIARIVWIDLAAAVPLAVWMVLAARSR